MIKHWISTLEEAQIWSTCRNRTGLRSSLENKQRPAKFPDTRGKRNRDRKRAHTRTDGLNDIGVSKAVVDIRPWQTECSRRKWIAFHSRHFRNFFPVPAKKAPADGFRHKSATQFDVSTGDGSHQHRRFCFTKLISAADLVGSTSASISTVCCTCGSRL